MQNAADTRWVHEFSLRRKLTRIVMLASCTALLLAGIAFASFDLYSFRKQMARDLETLAQITGSNSTAALTFNDPQAAQEILSSLSAKEHIIRAGIYALDGKLFAQYRRHDVPASALPPALGPEGYRFTTNRLIVFHRIVLDGQAVGTVYIESDLGELTSRLARYAGIVMIVLLASSLVAYFLSARLRGVISEPILNLAQTAFIVSVDKNYALRATKQSQDEMGFLVDRFNDMLGQIQERDDELERHREHLEEEVANRTAELRAVNAQLAAAKAKAEAARAQTELLLNSTAEAIYGVDLQGNCTFCNPACLRMLRRGDATALLGKNMHALIHHTRPDGEPYPVEECRIYQAFRKRVGTHADDEVLWRADGTSFPAEYWSYPVQRGGQVVGAVVTFVDITDRKRAEAALRETTQMLAALIEASPLAITAVDLAGKITAWNPAAERIFGWSEAEVKGDLPLHVPEDKREERGRQIEAVLRGEAPTLETVRVRKDGTRVDVRVSRAALRGAGGQVRGTMVMLEDITDRKRAEAELKKAKEAAEAASRAKSEFLANMSHEIRTPLNGILGMTDLALETSLSPEQREYLKMVKSSADSLLLVINDILDFSKIEAGKLDFDSIEFDLRDAIRQALNPLAVRAEQKGLEMVYSIAPDVPAKLISDPGRLRQVLVNLVGNAVKFTERGDVLVEVQVDERSEREVRLHFRIRDTGIGISLEQQQRIFEAFEQADTSMSRRFGGTGLGLTISARLVDMMRGRVWVESIPGQGSTFHFTAWLGIPELAAVEAVPAEPAALEGLSALVVDDNATNRRILEELLRNWRMHPESATDGKTGLARMQQALKEGGPFRLVLVDACMPEMDGFELAQRIKKDPELAGATVMMLSSGGLRGDAARCRELGVAAYLTKPVTQSELLDAILLAMGQPAVEGQPQRVITRHTIREKGRGLRVLLAEDNPVNQHLALRLLEKHGHEVVVVSNGRQALEAFKKQPFDLVLMDVQMPEMDGFEATAAIRAKEGATGAHVPIIALTAHAMKGDRERCLAAGMDGYLSKPVRSQELTKMIEDMRTKFGEESKPSAAASPAQPVADWDAALSHVEGDRELLVEMVDLFLADCPRLMEAIRDALARSDSKALERSAHTLKGTLANFAAGAALSVAKKLELQGRAGDLAGAAQACGELEKEIERFQAEMASFRREVMHENPDR